LVVGAERVEPRVLVAPFVSRSLRVAMVAPLGFHALPLPLAQLSLAAVLKCGQSFRWSIYPLHPTLPLDPSHEYPPYLQDRVVCLRQSPDTLFYWSVFPDSPVHPEVEAARDAETLLWIKDYFQLDVDLINLYNKWSEKNPVFAKLRGSSKAFGCSDRIHGRTLSRALLSSSPS